jgi:predicted ester cyclase
MIMHRPVSAFYGRVRNAGERAALDDLVTDDFRFQGSLGAPVIGRDAFWGMVSFGRGALSDYHCTIVDCVSEDGKAFAHGALPARTAALFRGAEPSGRRVEWQGAALFTFAGERISELWVLSDTAALDAALGVRVEEGCPSLIARGPLPRGVQDTQDPNAITRAIVDNDVVRVEDQFAGPRHASGPARAQVRNQPATPLRDEFVQRQSRVRVTLRKIVPDHAPVPNCCTGPQELHAVLRRTASRHADASARPHRQKSDRPHLPHRAPPALPCETTRHGLLLAADCGQTRA